MSFDIDKVREYVSSSSENSKIYIGVDSERFKVRDQWYADYAVVVVVHINGKHGCKVFGEVTRERDYDQKPNRPAIRLMNEVMKLAEFYQRFEDVIGTRYCELHLDINPDDRHGSSCVVQQAVGYIRGVCNIVPKLKPYGFAASICADRFKELAA